MFDELSEKLEAAFARLRGRGVLTEADIKDGLREVRRVLLEADVNFALTREFLERERTQDRLADRVARERLRRTGAAHRRAHQHEAARRQVGVIQEGIERNDAAEAVPDDVHPRAGLAQRPGELIHDFGQRSVRRLLAKHGRREAGPPQADPQQLGIQPCHPQAVDENDR